MGLLDQVLGQVLGGAMSGRGGGPLAPTRGGMGGGGLPGGLGGLLSGAKGPIAMAILAMLANKHLGSGAGGYGSILRDMMGGGGAADPRDPGRMPQAGEGGGGFLDQLGGMLGRGGGQAPMSPGPQAGGGIGGLGGALGGGLLGGALGTGLNDLLGRFSQAGHGDAVESWVGSGPNRALSPHDLEQALGPEEIDELSRHTGMGRDEFLAEMSDTLPKVVDGLTPHGRLPTEDETTQWV